MKIKLLLLILGLSFYSATAQFGSQQIITTNANGTFRAIPYDMDNDGFTDVVSASYGDGKIAWYRNQDGLGDFGIEQIITDSAITIEDMMLYDLDGDGDMDILYKTLYLDKVAWLENLDGQGDFGTEQIIADTYYPYFINAADLDGDGDLDVLALVHSSSVQNSIIWYENLDGQGDFGTVIFIDTSGDDSWGLELFDLDNDGDQDIISSFNSGPGKLIWYENLDSLGNFDSVKEIYQFPFFSNIKTTSSTSSWTVINSIISSDFNNDGKIDLLIDTILDEPVQEHIYWLENLDEQGAFSEPNYIDNACTFSGSLRTYDIDNDGDLDILSALHEFNHLENSTLAWYENVNGLGNFGSQQIISTEVIRVKDATAADLNGNGLLDVVSASSGDDKIAWYENGVLGISENKENSFKLYPNSAIEKVHIKSTTNISVVEIYNSLGEQIKTCLNSIEIDISLLASGNYIFIITDDLGNSEIHKVLK